MHHVFVSSILSVYRDNIFSQREPVTTSFPNENLLSGAFDLFENLFSEGLSACQALDLKTEVLVTNRVRYGVQWKIRRS